MSRTLVFIVLFSLTTLTATTTTPSTATTTTPTATTTTPTPATTTFTPTTTTTFTPTTTTFTPTTTAAADRPDVDDVPHFARWLVRRGKWGVIGIITPISTPFTYLASYTDARRGIPLFFLSKLDPVGKRVAADARASFTVSEVTVNGCRGSDPQSPSCAKITVSGQLEKIAEDSKAEAKAKKALFKAHPEFAGFPNMNGSFSVYKMEIQDIFLVNKPAPARNLTVEAYLGAY